jgi:AcrR family transcriptional regulator
MGYRHDRVAVLDAALSLACESGLHELTFRSVGRRMGIADRTAVYYFPTKEVLIRGVLERATAQLMELLAQAVDETPRPPAELLQACWDVLRRPTAGELLRLYVETVGMAARDREPYRAVTADLAAAWTSWFAPRLALAPAESHDGAVALLATLDGLIVLHVTVSPALASTAARGLGLRG